MENDEMRLLSTAEDICEVDKTEEYDGTNKRAQLYDHAHQEEGGVSFGALSVEKDHQSNLRVGHHSVEHHIHYHLQDIQRNNNTVEPPQ